MNYDQIETIINTLKSIEGALGRIADALEESNKPKGLTIPRNWSHGIADCVSKEEIPLSTAWNDDYKPACKSDDLTNDLYR